MPALTRVKIYKATEGLCDFLMRRVTPLAYPGRGGTLPPVLVVSLPKSGSVYLQRALRRTLRVQIQNFIAAGMFGSRPDYGPLLRVQKGNLVAREHMQPRAISLRILAGFGVRKIVLHLRDPRAAIVSWTRHMDRSLERGRGLAFVELNCDMEVPADYAAWSFEQRLHWQVRNMLPKFVQWTADWLDLVDQSREVKFLVTDYSELNADARGLIARILEFNEIDYQPDWIKIPVVRVGKNNIFTVPDPARPAGSNAMPGWVAAMARAQDSLQIAAGMVPTAMLDRFNWPKI